ncbi:unnamed protein product [Rotaria socialis]|uniref:Superoxide dismutase [Cu-Zn] n=1 Tax=Rotaria socialis TaxID=392032 RepID=A0A818V8R0_9BILA|nr:unnamed protein product [Rotaria socialis]
MIDTVKGVSFPGPSSIQAVAVLSHPNSEQVYGHVDFVQEKDGAVTVSGEVKNISAAQKHGFHIHEFGDTMNGCTSVVKLEIPISLSSYLVELNKILILSAHYNPDNNEHAGPPDELRHVGDLVIKLTDPTSTIGRSIVVHEKEDDVGRDGTPNSKKTGNAGSRVACGEIGLKTI